MFDLFLRMMRLSLFALCLAALPLRAALPTGVVCSAFYDTASIHFSMPIWFGEHPALPGTFLVAEMAGDITLLEPSPAGLKPALFANVRVNGLLGNDGLLGMAFHPDFKKNHKYYVYYNSSPGHATLMERETDALMKTDAGISRVILVTDFSPTVVHNGGDLHFGRDGLLYLSTGDGGNPNVYNNHSQDLTLLQGKMLRIDVDRAEPGLAYAIPADNPFAQRRDSARKEIYAYGLRQPWRWSFDVDGRLIVADVGDWVEEEIDVIKKGGNYGWSRMEGTTCFNPANETAPLDSCDTTGLILPIAAMRHVPITTAPSHSIIGGYVFRGDKESPFYGTYIFGDHEAGKLYGLPPGGTPEELATVPGMSAFGMDAHGGLYLVGFETGKIFRLDHPGLQGKGLAVRPFAETARALPLRRMSGGWLLDARAFPGAARVRVFAIDGRAVAAFDAAALASGSAVLDLPRGLYLARSQGAAGASGIPLLLE